MSALLAGRLPLAFFLGFLMAPLLAGVTSADIYVYKDSQGTLHFSNVPSHSGFRRVIREWSGDSGPGLAPGRLEEMIWAASERYGVDPHLVRSVMRAESAFNAQARSHKGAQGLMQLMPETARLHNVSNAYDPDENIHGGVRHLRMLLDHYRGDLRLTLAAYNAGIKAVERYGGIPPYPETREYIRRVLKYHQSYRGNGTITIKDPARR